MLDADDSSAYRVSQDRTGAVDNDANAAVYSTYLPRGMHLTRLKVEMVSTPRSEGKQDETEKDLTRLIEGGRASWPILSPPTLPQLRLPGGWPRFLTLLASPTEWVPRPSR